MKILKKVSFITIIIMFIFVGKVFAATGKVTASAVRIRENTSTESGIITNAYKGDEVEILSEEGDWYKVKYKESTGYVKKEFIEKDETSNTNTNTNIHENTITSNSSENSNTDNNINTNSTDNTTSNTSDNSNNTVSNSVNNESTVENNTTSNNISNKVISNSVIGLKLNPNLMSITVAQFENGKELTKLDEINNWIKVTDGTVTGWITKVKVSEKTENTEVPENTTDTNKEEKKDASNNQTDSETNLTSKNGIVNVETANVRAEASSTSERIGFLDYNDAVTILAVEGDWYKINYENTTGYVSKDLITLQENRDITSRSSAEGRIEENNKTISSNESEINNSQDVSMNNGTKIAEYAKQYLGTKYIVGGKTPEVGFDCSGFTRYVYSNFGCNLGTTSTSQSNSGTEIARENMKIGDLIIFYNEEKSNVGHTAIYIGDGNFIHSANPERGVVIDNLNTNTYYNERFISARRIVD